VRVENTFLGAEGVGEGIESRLWEAGITHWESFHRDCPGIGPTRAERIESFITDGRRALEEGSVEYFDRRFPNRETWRLYESFADRTCFFDIETTGLSEYRDVVTTVTLHQDGTTRTLVRGDDLTDESLRAAFEPADVLVTYNGASFDVPFLAENFDIEFDQAHIDLMNVCRRVGLTGGLSGVERQLGIGRELPDVDGREAVRLWHRHESGEDGALERLIEYNREDTINMVPVLERTIERLDRNLGVAEHV
jgi:uncharacterized protein YprB with RNaseH-like and TPR domain